MGDQFEILRPRGEAPPAALAQKEGVFVADEGVDSVGIHSPTPCRGREAAGGAEVRGY